MHFNPSLFLVIFCLVSPSQFHLSTVNIQIRKLAVEKFICRYLKFPVCRASVVNFKQPREFFGINP